MKLISEVGALSDSFDERHGVQVERAPIEGAGKTITQVKVNPDERILTLDLIGGCSLVFALDYGDPVGINEIVYITRERTKMGSIATSSCGAFQSDMVSPKTLVTAGRSTGRDERRAGETQAQLDSRVRTLLDIAAWQDRG